MLQKYYIWPAPTGSNSFSVFERGRTNAWGEPYCVEGYLTYEQAQQLRDKLNKEATEKEDKDGRNK